MAHLPGLHGRLRSAACIVFIAATISVSIACSDDNTSSNDDEITPPNIILIVTDDMAASDIEFMPNVQSLLIDQGTYIPNFIASDPSHATVLRGQYAHNHGVLTNAVPEGGFAAFKDKGLEQSTIATWLHDSGYRTALVGKYMDGYPYTDAAETMGDPAYIPTGWDDWYAPLGAAAYEQFNYQVNENGTLVDYGDAPEDFGVDVLSRHAVSVIARAETDSAPFFLYVAPLTPHGPAASAARHESLFADATVPDKPSLTAFDVSDKPEYLSSLPILTADQRQEIDGLYGDRLRSLQSVDDMVGDIIEQLTTSDALDNTYIFFTSDNGYLLGEHRVFSGNQFPHEESIRVSLAVRGPDVPSGQIDSRLAVTTDLAPTIAAIAGVPAPEFVDGRSLLPLLGKADISGAAWRRSVLLEFSPAPDGTSPVAVTPPRYSGLRSDFSMYAEYATGELELYILSEDPYQLLNAAGLGTDSQATVYASLLALLESCAGEKCLDAENVSPPP